MQTEMPMNFIHTKPALDSVVYRGISSHECVDRSGLFMTAQSHRGLFASFSLSPLGPLVAQAGTNVAEAGINVFLAFTSWVLG